MDKHLSLMQFLDLYVNTHNPETSYNNLPKEEIEELINKIDEEIEMNRRIALRTNDPDEYYDLVSSIGQLLIKKKQLVYLLLNQELNNERNH